jgi:hypothetical protein
MTHFSRFRDRFQRDLDPLEKADSEPTPSPAI